MRAMARLERFFERLVERPSARLFRTRLRPIQVLRRIERAMEADRRDIGGLEVVPDRYRARLNPADLAELGALDSVAQDLASAALRFARSHGYNLRDHLRVSLHADSAVRKGEVDVATAFSPPVAAHQPGSGGDAGTRAYEVPIVRAPRVRLEISEPRRPARRVDIEAEPMSIGRSPDCDLVLDDSRASRHHARLRPRGGVIVLTDLSSTNGTFVNNQRVSEVVLGEGDQIQIGETRLVVARIADGDSRPSRR